MLEKLRNRTWRGRAPPSESQYHLSDMTTMTSGSIPSPTSASLPPTLSSKSSSSAAAARRRVIDDEDRSNARHRSTLFPGDGPAAVKMGETFIIHNTGAGGQVTTTSSSMMRRLLGRFSFSRRLNLLKSKAAANNDNKGGGGDDDTGGNQDSPISSSQTMETASRWRPEEGLAALSQATKFSRSELKLMYRGFKQECPTGLMTELEFRDIYAKFFPMGDCSQYAKYVFSTLDKEGDGVVSFGTVIRVLSLLFRGSVHDRLHWLFSLYDVNRDGFISRADVADVVESIYGILGSGNTVPQVDEAGCRQHAERVFLRLLSRNNASSSSSSEFISERDFVEHCLKDVQLQESLGVFDDPW